MAIQSIYIIHSSHYHSRLTFFHLNFLYESCTVQVSSFPYLASDGGSDGHKGSECSSTLDHHFANVLDQFPAPQSHSERTETSEYGSWNKIKCYDKNETIQFSSDLSTCRRSCPSWSPSSFCQNTRAGPLRNFPAAQASLSESVKTILTFFRFSLLAIYILLTCVCRSCLCLDCDCYADCWLLAWLYFSCGKQQLLGLVWNCSKIKMIYIRKQ